MEKLERFSGFFVAAVTPFDEHDQINTCALDKLIAKTISQGASGFLVAGSSGEFPLLTLEERMEVFDACAKYKENTVLIANVTAVSLKEAAVYAQCAEKLGFHAVMSTAPYYFKFDMKAIADYFRALKNTTDLPLFLYNFPVNTGVEIDIDHPDISSILTDGTLAGVKQTSINLGQLERMKNKNPGLAVFAGYDDVYLAAKAIGADGAIGSTFNFSLPLFTPIEQAFRARDIVRAQAFQSRANDVISIINRCGLFPSIKYILTKQGIQAGNCRSPFPPLSQSSKRMLDGMMNEYLNA